MSDRTTASDWDGFDDMLETLIEAFDDLPDYGQFFVTDMSERHEKYGDLMFVSEKQWEFMRQLAHIAEEKGW